MKAIATLLLLALAACSSLKPVVDRSRFFVLTEVKCAHSEAGSAAPAIGIAKVELPEYLRSRPIAVRVGNDEIKLSDTYFWAERLDASIPRILARDMSLTNVYFSAWKRDAVALEIYLAVEEFDISETGTATLRVRYRITTPAGSQTLYSDVAEFSRHGASLADNPSVAVESLAGVISDLSCEIAHQVTRAKPPR